MVLGYHVILGAYGFWPPNDPRGSWSEFVGAWELFRHGGPATKTTETRSLAKKTHDRSLRLRTKEALKYPAVRFTGVQARASGRGFAEYTRRAGLVVWACAILPEHLHLVVGRGRLSIEQIVIQLKGAATEQLLKEELHPFGHVLPPNGRPPKCFARGQCAPFLDTIDDVIRSIRYVEENPVREGKRRQRWPFVTRFDPAFVDTLHMLR